MFFLLYKRTDNRVFHDFLKICDHLNPKIFEDFPKLSTLQAESPAIFLDKSGRGRRLCERLQDSLIRRSSEKMDESVQFPVGQTGFLLTRMIIHLSGFSTAICMCKCRDHVNCTRANKLSLRVFSWCYRLFTLQNY